MNGAPNGNSRETKPEKPASIVPRPPAPAVLIRDTPLQPLHCLKVSRVLQDGVGPVHGGLLGGGHGRRLCVGSLNLSAGKNQGQAHARKTDPLQPDLLLVLRLSLVPRTPNGNRFRRRRLAVAEWP